jgi:hypothetical protein
MNEMYATAEALVAPGRGILAAEATTRPWNAILPSSSPHNKTRDHAFSPAERPDPRGRREYSEARLGFVGAGLS